MITSLDSNSLRFDMFTGEERFIAPNAVLVSARTDAVQTIPAPDDAPGIMGVFCGEHSIVT